MQVWVTVQFDLALDLTEEDRAWEIIQEGLKVLRQRLGSDVTLDTVKFAHHQRTEK